MKWLEERKELLFFVVILIYALYAWIAVTGAELPKNPPSSRRIRTHNPDERWAIEALPVTSAPSINVIVRDEAAPKGQSMAYEKRLLDITGRFVFHYVGPRTEFEVCVRDASSASAFSIKVCAPRDSVGFCLMNPTTKEGNNWIERCDRKDSARPHMYFALGESRFPEAAFKMPGKPASSQSVLK